MIDCLRILSTVSFPIADYRYTGLGSLYFVDFIMLHKLLGIDKLTSVEHSADIKKRVEFNKPYDCINILIRPISEVIPTLSRDERHILWFDYDDVLHEEQLEDVWQAASILSTGSVLIVTIDVEPPLSTDADGVNIPKPAEWKQYFEDVAGTYLGDRPKEAYTKRKLLRVNLEVISKAISSGVSGRLGVEAIPLFHFSYADGHRMLTMGCVIGTARERRRVQSSSLSSQIYYRRSFDEDAYQIQVPIVTAKERLRLDSAMPCADGWVPRRIRDGECERNLVGN